MLNTNGPRKLKYSSAVNIVMHGNSLIAGIGASGSAAYLYNQMAGKAPLSGSGIPISNYGYSGYTWEQLNTSGGGSTAVDGAYVSGKKNVLVVWETTNSIAQGDTAAQCITALQTYINARKAANSGWKIILISTLPRQGSVGSYTIAQANAAIDTVNSQLLANYRAWGINAIADIRAPGSPWGPANFPDYSTGSFNNASAYWHESSGSYIHLNDAGYGVVADAVNRTLARLAA